MALCSREKERQKVCLSKGHPELFTARIIIVVIKKPACDYRSRQLKPPALQVEINDTPGIVYSYNLFKERGE